MLREEVQLREIPEINEILKKARVIPLDNLIDISKFKTEYNAYFNKMDPAAWDTYRDMAIEEDQKPNSKDISR